jgi:hypothetical protein
LPALPTALTLAALAPELYPACLANLVALAAENTDTLFVIDEGDDARRETNTVKNAVAGQVCPQQVKWIAENCVFAAGKVEP